MDLKRSGSKNYSAADVVVAVVDFVGAGGVDFADLDADADKFLL